MGVRRNATTLSQNEKTNLVNAIRAVKQTIVTSRGNQQISVYDQFVAIHLGITRRFDASNQNLLGDGGHGNAAFLPWHREFLRRYEAALQQVDPGVTLPYWDWTEAHTAEAILFQDDFMGPDGGANDVVQTGPFSQTQGWSMDRRLHIPFLGWTGPDSGLALLRNFRAWEELPTRGDELRLLSHPTLSDFRPDLEAGPPQGGRRTHNFIHTWMRGSMQMMSSPQDPVFFLHHANVDRIWALWQDTGHEGPAFYPAAGRPYGHNLDDRMWPWDGAEAETVQWVDDLLPTFAASDVVTPRDVLDFRQLGYSYE